MALNSDQPKTTKGQDALGFADSAESVAKSIFNSNFPDGFVIGIDGDWGSGKTTFINFIRESLKEQSPEFKIIEFKPWLHSNHENLITAYFKFLSEKTEGIFSNTEGIKQGFANMMAITSQAANAFSGLTPEGAALLPISFLMKCVSKLMLKLPTLESQYDKVHCKLKTAKIPLLVIIDDLDRLDKTEIKTMLKLVKSVGKLPYITYILAYDRDYVENATKDDMPDRKTTFLQKIIQVTFHIPKPDKNKLLAMLKDETAEFLKTIDENSSRWYALDTASIHPYINKPRDVALLANAINFHFNAMNKILDPVDFRALESLRLFDKKLWDWIRDNGHIVLEVGDFGLLHHDINDFKKALEKSLSVKLEDLSRNQKTTLSVLFPNLANALDGHEFGVTEADYDAHNRFGVRIPSVYDAYFSQYLDKNAISKANIDRFLENTANKERLTKELLRWIDKDNDYKNSRITEFLRKLSYRFMDKNSPNPDQTLLWVLSDTFKYTKPLQELSSSHRASPYRYLEYTLRILFEKIGKQETTAFLQALCKDTKHLDAAVYLLFYVGYYIGKTYNGDKSSEEIDLIDESDWDKILKIIAPHLKDAFLTGEIGNFAHVISANFLAPLIFDARQVRSMIRKASVESEPYLIKSIKGYLNYITSTDGSRHTFRESRYPELFDFDFTAECAENINLKKYDDETQKAVKLFIKGVRTPELLTNDEKDIF